MNDRKNVPDSTLENYPDVLTVQQVRSILRIGRVGVYKLLENGKIHSFKIGKIYKIPKISLMEYLRKSDQGGTEE